ncbi:hypothetical protein [Halocatena pleomorpha]|uniref:Uncharacterized protein n=1 Tax=Halocatena pleomorpha TaxID=1785090 RepID=A0A3P3RKR7_9EURY|nr:hypothetical protein [Halocatena pleomorpha]RRJ34012.1 hypothetical protein EIK79_00360 [Halocatena pleomorpha]
MNRRSYLKLIGGAAVAGIGGVPAVRGADGLHRTLTIEGPGASTNYEFTVEGDLAKSTAFGGTIHGHDEISGSTASGHVGGGRDSYTFSGEITSWSGDYDALTLYLNGEELKNLITIKGRPDQSVSYRLRVDGEVLKSTEFAGSINDSDEISGRTKDYGLDTSIRTEDDLRGETVVEGSVSGGTDSFLYSGDVSDLTTDAELEVYINSELVKYEEFERDTITIDGCGCEIAREYSFTVETDVAKTDAYNASINSGDTIDGSEVTGSVVSGRDSYVYTGEIQAIDIPSSIQVLKNGTEVTPGSLLGEKRFQSRKLPHTLTISIDRQERVDYGFSVTGDLATGPLGNSSSGDRAANGYGRGYGANTGADEYLYSGELASLSDFTCLQLDVDHDYQQLIVRDLTNSANPPYGYEITVSGALSKADSNNNATIDGGTVSGKVAGKTDVFDFTGELIEVIFPTSIKVKFERDINQAIGYKSYSLRCQYGSYHYEVDIDACTETIERGHFVFSDGTRIPVAAEFVSENKVRYTIDGEEFKLGGGWP